MKGTKIAVAAVFALMSGRAYAFHSGGVGECEGCHTMHNSQTTVDNPTAEETMSFVPGGVVGQANPFLLQGTDQGSTCLHCHANTPSGSYHILAPGLANAGNTGAANFATQLNFTPGGDFAWTLNTWNYTGYEGPASQAGNRAGHNVVAADFGMQPDARLAPPGSNGGAEIGWGGANLACSSCHDPHGRYRYTSSTGATAFATTGAAITGSGSYGDSRGVRIASYAAKITSTITVGAYRILGGVGYRPKSGNGPSAGFVADPPIALAPSSYNVSESPVGTSQWAGQVQVAYGQGMSEWCGNCHPRMHSDTVEGATVTGLTRHPAGNGAKLGAIAANYNHYISSGNVNGSLTDNYDSIVPFEQGTANLDVLKNNTTLTNYGGGYVAVAASATASNVMCLSCHRAHAAGFNYSTRWYNEAEFITSTSGWATAKGTSTATAQNATVVQAAMYMRPSSMYGSYQRSMCNKCHGKD